MPQALTTSYWQDEVGGPIMDLWLSHNIQFFSSPLGDPPDPNRYLLEVDPDTAEIRGISEPPRSPLLKSSFTRYLQLLFAKHRLTRSGEITCPVTTPFKTSYWTDFLDIAQTIPGGNDIIFRSYGVNRNALDTSGGNILLNSTADAMLSLLPSSVRAAVTSLKSITVFATRLVGLPGVASIGTAAVSGGNLSSFIGAPDYTTTLGFSEGASVANGMAAIAQTPYFDFAVLSSADLSAVNARDPISVQGGGIGPFTFFGPEPAVGEVITFDCA